MKTNLSLTILCVIAFSFSVSEANAKYRRPDLEKIPVERLVDNLARVADKDPKDAAVRFNLARPRNGLREQD